MNPEIQRLFNVIDTPPYPPGGPHETGNIACILEINHGHDRNHSMYDTLLTPEQRTIILSPDEQEEIVRELLKRVENGHPFSSSLMWAAGKAIAARSTALIQDYFLRHYREMDDELIYQSIIALQDSLISRDKDHQLKIRFAELKAMFESLVLTHPKAHYGGVARHSQHTINWLNNDDYWQGKRE